jgi:hypothetical protein
VTERDANLALEVRAAPTIADGLRGEPHNLWLRSLHSVRVSAAQ